MCVYINLRKDIFLDDFNALQNIFMSSWSVFQWRVLKCYDYYSKGEEVVKKYLFCHISLTLHALCDIEMIFSMSGGVTCS